MCRSSTPGATLSRFTWFNLTNGVISIVANTVITLALVENWHVHYMLANTFSVAACAVGNFLVSDLFIFVTLLMTLGTSIEAAELHPQAAEAFDRYARLAESRMDREKRGELPFLSIDALPERERREAEGGTQPRQIHL